MAGKRAARIVKKKSGILLDVSLGGTPQPNSVTCRELGMDPRRPKFPLPTASVHTAVVTHVLEYVEPAQVFSWFDELHRVMRPGGVVYMSGPYGGEDCHGWIADPSHKTRVVEQTVAWLDPRLPFFSEHPNLGRPVPKPWHVLQTTRVPGTHGSTGYNFVLAAQAVKKGKR